MLRICRHRAGWERFLPSLRRLVPMLIDQSNIRRRSSGTIYYQFSRGLAAATIMALRGPTTIPANIAAGPITLTAPACPMYAASTVTADRMKRLSPLAAEFLGKVIAQADRPVEHRMIRR